MKLSAVLFAAVGFTLAVTLSADAQSIGINFATGRNAAEIDLLNTDEIAGAIAQGFWNNVTGNNGNLANVASPTAGVLVNHTGASTTLSLSFTSTNSWSTYGSTQTGDNAQLLNGYLDNTNAATPTTITLTAIPFAAYQIYIYVGSDTNGRIGHVALSGGPTSFFSTITAGSFDGTFTAATGTSTADANPAEYILFGNLSGASQTITVTRDTGNVGVHAVQVVAVPEPSAALLLLGVCGVGAVARRRAARI